MLTSPAEWKTWIDLLPDEGFGEYSKQQWVDYHAYHMSLEESLQAQPQANTYTHDVTPTQPEAMHTDATDEASPPKQPSTPVHYMTD